MTQNDWAERYTRSVVAAIRRRREALGLSTQKLSDACASLGHPVQRSVLANLEGGRRPMLTVAELLVIARALDLPPIALVAPLGCAESVEILPDVEVAPARAMRWFDGACELDGTDPPPGWGSLIGDHFEHDRLVVHLQEVMAAVAADPEPPQPGSLADLSQMHRDLWYARKRMRARGEVPPALPAGLVWADSWPPARDMPRRVDPGHLPLGFRQGEPFAWERGRATGPE